MLKIIACGIALPFLTILVQAQVTFVEYPTPTGASVPTWITSGPDGNLWFTEGSANKIGKITPSGAITEYGPTGAVPVGIVAGPDGNLWFTEETGNNIGRITTA